jgi:farnesyl-diphosphate farnesyltransferase
MEMIPTHSDLIGPLLRDVSRSFYLTLRFLPGRLRPQISLAYLLARATDTIADTKALPPPERIRMLQHLRSGFATRNPSQTQSILLDIAQMAQRAVQHQVAPAEKELLGRLDRCFSLLTSLPEADQGRIADLMDTIIAGQIFDLTRFPGESADELVALEADDELDWYTYMVAGCVGEFWTRMCLAHVPSLEDWNSRQMNEWGVRFGQGLQLVNILRDIPRDLRMGRCYLPVTNPRDLLDPEKFELVRPIYHRWLDTALECLSDGWKYTMQIPWYEPRLRIACVLPIWIGLMTVARLRHVNPLDPSKTVKISRREVYGVLGIAGIYSFSDTLLNNRFRFLRDDAL